MELITISGPARVGKTTMAYLIAKEAFALGFIPKVLGFAEPLKIEAGNRGLTKKDSPAKYREFCQVQGALKREGDPNYWVNSFEKILLSVYEKELQDLKDGRGHWERCIIIDDCRYENELSLAKKHKGVCIYMSPGKRILEDHDADWRNHHSEELSRKIEEGDDESKALFNYLMLNDGDKEDLETKVETMAPIWCNLQAGFTQEFPVTLSDLMEELADLLMFDMEEDTDEDT